MKEIIKAELSNGRRLLLVEAESKDDFEEYEDDYAVLKRYSNEDVIYDYHDTKLPALFLCIEGFVRGDYSVYYESSIKEAISNISCIKEDYENIVKNLETAIEKLSNLRY